MPHTQTNLNSLLSVLSKLHDGVILTNSKLNITFANHAAHEIFGYSPRELIGANISDLIPEEHRAHHQHLTDTYMHNPVPRLMNPSMRLEGTNRTGETIPLIVSLDPIETESETMILVLIRDIRTVVRMETELFHARKLETIGKTAAGIIHDLKNVLHIINSSNYFAKKDSSGNALKYLDDIDTQTQVANNMLTSLLNYLRHGNPAAKRINLGDSLKALEPVARSLLPKRVEFNVEAGDEHLHVHSTSTSIEQVLLNLLFNAGDAIANATQPKVTVSLMKEKGSGNAILSVADNGCGMSDKVKANLFQAFFTTKESKGTGLGLASVYGAVVDIGGQIEVESNEGMGTTFFISLPTVA
ncbi:PAS domain S-box-containing protein [Mariprofundus ferrinatatus]|uniref:histidine kinase n=1 Tax=Mariprofundus ferrinatatus TaxID=1921087 RepID=A0A2K8L1Y0_9PROT|nr:ATP-binding protein [Mariprofundus ferrinatatus]ATX81318.1 PAS domain S-box-containing protein [Mariprofundus ferrinatatus]